MFLNRHNYRSIQSNPIVRGPCRTISLTDKGSVSERHFYCSSSSCCRCLFQFHLGSVLVWINVAFLTDLQKINHDGNLHGSQTWYLVYPSEPTKIHETLQYLTITYTTEKIDFFNDCDDLIRNKERAITTICSRYDLANITGKLMVFTRINKISQICIDLYGIEDERERGWLNNPYYKKFDLYQGCRCSPAYSCRGSPPECCRPCRSSGRSDCCGRTFSTAGADGSRVMKRMR